MTGHPRELRRRIAIGAGGLFVLGCMLVTPTTSSYYYDLETVTGSFSAGEWESEIPAACGDLAQYQEIIIYGTDGPDDPLPLGGEHTPPGNDNQPEPQPGNKGQVILGLGGDDVIYGGNAKDCLVGGPGDDIIYGNNGNDIILGGLGHDTLYGDNGPDSLEGGEDDDYLDGGKGPDECAGGAGDDELVSCEDEAEPAGAGGTSTTKTLASGSEAGTDARAGDASARLTDDSDSPVSDDEVEVVQPQTDADDETTTEDPAPVEPEPSGEPPTADPVENPEPNDVTGDIADSQPVTE